MISELYLKVTLSALDVYCVLTKNNENIIVNSIEEMLIINYSVKNL